MKKGDLIIIVLGLVIMGGLLLGYRIVLNRLGDERYVQIVYKGKQIYYEELTAETHMEILIVEGEIQQIIDRKETPNSRFDLMNVKDYNIVKIYNKGIQVIDADCESKDDVRKGFTNRPYDAIICAPHFLKIEILAPNIDRDSDLDGVVGNG